MDIMPISLRPGASDLKPLSQAWLKFGVDSMIINLYICLITINKLD